MNKIVDLKNKRVTILGAARSGIAAAELLKLKGVQVFVSDLAIEEKKKGEIEKLEGLGVPFEFGEHSNKALNADFVVLSPGIPCQSEFVRKIDRQGIPIFSEIEVASWFCESPVIAITGSNGKTTTTMLTGEMLKKEQPHRIMAGNIGDPFAAQVLNSRKDQWAVVEVSSFQLETIDNFHPKVAVILNLAPNHLDRYDSYEDYISAKMRILKNLDEDDFVIYNADDELLSDKISGYSSQKRSFSKKNSTSNAYLKGEELIIDSEVLTVTSKIRLNGIHNYMNIMAAALASGIAKISFESIRHVLKSFAGVEHRLEFVRELNGINFVNDSKATTIESMAVALKSFSRPVILIAGGKDKGSDFSKLNHLVKKHVREIILIGAAKEKIAENWESFKPVHFAETLKEAVHLAYQQALKNETVLLSPACASFDMFTDYEDRGRQFKKIVLQLN